MDTVLYDLMQQELQRQRESLSLIASENYTSEAVMKAQGSASTNKYAEGYPGRRYYAGCAVVDKIEQLAIDRAKSLYNVVHANVQPHAGATANLAVFQALMQPGDVFMGLGLADGGHLSHGAKVNLSGKNYHAVTYHLDPQTELLDYDAIYALAIKHRPKLIIAGFSAYAPQIDWQEFRRIADAVDAYLLADIAHISGLIVAGLYPSPAEYADVLTTTTHKSLRGPRGGMMMACRDLELAKRLDKAIFPGTQGGPMMHTVAAKAQALYEAAQPDFVAYQQQVLDNAQAMAKRFIKHGYDLVSGGTQSHLILVKMGKDGITGQAAEQRLAQANLWVNKNTIPGDTRSAFVTSGIRLGTPGITTRGLVVKHVEQLVDWMVALLQSPEDDDLLLEIRKKVIALALEHDCYGPELKV